MENIIIALIGSGAFSAIVSGVVTLISKKIDKKADKQEEISNQISQLSNDVKNIDAEVKSVRKELNDFKEESQEEVAESVRYRLLRFSDEIRHGEMHSEEHYGQIRQDITKYERYCKKHPDFPNESAVASIELIRKTYEKCSEEQNFL